MTTDDLEIIYTDLTLVAKNKKVLKNISGNLKSNEITAIQGPSGAGKSTLLNTLSGRINNVELSGNITINGSKRSNVNWSSMIGYVEQEFFAYDNQTVEETFDFICELKGIDKKKIDETIDMLNLSSCKKNMIKHLSGGEKKRVSIGLELLNDPPILFLDEPTSGLDSFNALNILETLRKIKNKCILMTIHQTSYKMLEYFDKIILLSEGFLVYEGTINDCMHFFRDNGFTCPEFTCPTDYFLEIITINSFSKELKEKSLKNLYKLVSSFEKKRFEIKVKNIKIKEIKNSNNFFPLLKRNASNYLRNRNFLFLQIAQKTFFMLILGIMYFELDDSDPAIQSLAGLASFLTINTVFGTSSPIFNTFAIEKKIIMRERNSGLYNGFDAYFTKLMVESLVSSTFITIYIFGICLMTKAALGFKFISKFIFLHISLVNYSCSFALAISAIVQNHMISQVVGSMINILFILNGGFYSNSEAIPRFIKWLSLISPINYAFKASLQILLKSKSIMMEYMINDKLKAYNADAPGLKFCLLFIWLFVIFNVVVGSIFLNQKTRINLFLNEKKLNEKNNYQNNLK